MEWKAHIVISCILLERLLSPRQHIRVVVRQIHSFYFVLCRWSEILLHWGSIDSKAAMRNPLHLFIQILRNRVLNFSYSFSPWDAFLLPPIPDLSIVCQCGYSSPTFPSGSQLQNPPTRLSSPLGLDFSTYISPSHHISRLSLKRFYQVFKIMVNVVELKK